MTEFVMKERINELRNEALWSLHALMRAATGVCEAPSVSVELDTMALVTIYHGLELWINSKADAFLDEIANGGV